MGKQFAIIGFGEAGQTFSHAGKWTDAHVYDVKTDDSAQTAEMYKAFENCGVTAGDRLAEILPGAEYVLSLVTADQSLSVAQGAAKHLSSGTCYFDMNSVSPGTKCEAAKVIEEAGASYIDAAIMAPVNPKRLTVPLLLSGPNAEHGAAILGELGFSDIKLVGDKVGKASTIKMLRSVMIKGVEALTAECVLAAEKGEVLPEVLENLGGDWPEKANYRFDRMMVHGLRRAAEMREVEKTLLSLGVEPLLTKGTVARHQAFGELGVTEIAETLEAKLDQCRRLQEDTPI